VFTGRSFLCLVVVWVEMSEGSFRWDDFYIHQSQNVSITTAKDCKTLSPAASRLHWMQMISDKPILPVVTAFTSCSTSSCRILFTGDAREGREARLLDGRSVAGGVSDRSDDSKPSGSVSLGLRWCRGYWRCIGK
jgi:hypothetical protein